MAAHTTPAEVEQLLVAPGLADSVDVVVRRTGVDRYRAAAARGAVEFRHGPGGTELVEATGTDPLATGSDRPHAHDEIAQFFDSPAAPDVAIVHTDAHRYHGNIGEHGSLSLGHRRAPLLAAGAGIAAGGWIDHTARTADLAPTVASVLGVPRRRGLDRYGRPADVLMARQDGGVLPIVDGTADRALVVLFDGANAQAVRAAVEGGRAPVLAGLVDRGVALDGGMLASLPSATLANHTTLNTGAMPGHSGILHNEWRADGVDHDLLDLEQMFQASSHLRDDVETLHEAVHRLDPDAFTAAVHEFADRGADRSTFRDMAARVDLPFARSTDSYPRNEEWCDRSDAYRRMTRVDETALRCALGLWADDHPVPRFAFVSFALTDEAGHDGGPFSEQASAAIADCDERLGRLLDAVAARGVLDETAVFVVADHGMADTEPEQTSDLAYVLPDGVTLLDGSFVYLS